MEKDIVVDAPSKLDINHYEETIVKGRRTGNAPLFPRLLLLIPRSKQVCTVSNLTASNILKAFVKIQEDDLFVEVIRVYDDMCSDELLKRLLNDATGNFMEVMGNIDASQTLPAVLLFKGTLEVGSWVSRTVCCPPASLVLSAYKVDTEQDLRTIDDELRRVALPRIKIREGTKWKPLFEMRPHPPEMPRKVRVENHLSFSSSLLPSPCSFSKNEQEKEEKDSPITVLEQVFGHNVKRMPSGVGKNASGVGKNASSGWEPNQRAKK